jgi:ribosomal protein L37AE/L43A
MAPDTQLASTVVLAAAIGWTMVFTGRKKRLLEPKRRRRRCPSCGRTIVGRVCDRH